MNGNLATLNEFFVTNDTKGLHYINIFLNDYSKWLLQGFFAIYINDLPQECMSDFKLFTVYASLFSIVIYEKAAAPGLNSDFSKFKSEFVIGKYLIQAKLNTQDIIFLWKILIRALIFSSSSTVRLPKFQHVQNHFHLHFDNTLLFNEHINNKFSKATKEAGVLYNLQPFLPCERLLIARCYWWHTIQNIVFK